MSTLPSVTEYGADPPIWVRLFYCFMNWAAEWKPLNFDFLDYRYRFMDDACGCFRCQERRDKGLQGPRKWGV